MGVQPEIQKGRSKMARFNASAFRSKISQAQSKLRTAQSNLRRLQSDLTRADQRYRRSIAELERALRSAQTRVVVVTRAEWHVLAYHEQRQLQNEAELNGVELHVGDDESG